MKLYSACSWPWAKTGVGPNGFGANDMKTYLAEHSLDKGGVGDTSRARETLPELRLRVLLSYHYYRDVDLYELFGKYFEKPWPDVFLDSGAFSAITQGAEIDLGAYCEWVKHHEDLANVYANLDVIGDHEATTANQRTMESRGLNPLPVFHTREPWSALEALVGEYPYIALGGQVGINAAALRPWLRKCFAIAGNRTVFHGFGVTAWRLMNEFPWYSVDSSSWGTGFRFGVVSLFDERLGKFVKVNLRDKEGAWKHRKLLTDYGFGMSDLAIEGRYDRAKICAMSALAYMRAERWLRKLHGEVVIPSGDRFPGSRDERGPRGDHVQRERPEGAGDDPQGPRCYIATAASNPTTGHGSNQSCQAISEALGLRPVGTRVFLAESNGAGGGADMRALGCISLTEGVVGSANSLPSE